MRWFAKAAAAVAAVALLAGCSAGGGSGSGDTTLQWWVVNPSNQKAQDALNKIIDNFQTANPGIKVQLTTRAVDAHKDALRQAIGTSAAPDIYQYWAGPGLGGELVKANASADLSDYYKQYNWDSRFTDAALAPVKQYGGDQGVPFKLNGEAIYYNKKLFAKAGITNPPTSLAELDADAQKLKDSGVTPIEFGGTVNWHVMRILDTFLEGNCASSTFDSLVVTKKANWGNEQCVTKSFTELQKWSKDYFNPGFIGINNDESSSLFYSGKAAMALEGDWFNASVTSNKMTPDDVGVFALPTGTGRLYGFEEAEYITKDSAHKDAAAKFIDYLTSTKVQQDYLGTFATQSVNKEVKSQATDSLTASWNKIFADSKGLFMNNDQNLSQTATTEYWRIQNLVATGGMDPSKAGAEFQKFLDSNS